MELAGKAVYVAGDFSRRTRAEITAELTARGAVVRAGIAPAEDDRRGGTTGTGTRTATGTEPRNTATAPNDPVATSPTPTPLPPPPATSP